MEGDVPGEALEEECLLLLGEGPRAISLHTLARLHVIFLFLEDTPNKGMGLLDRTPCNSGRSCELLVSVLGSLGSLQPSALSS